MACFIKLLKINLDIAEIYRVHTTADVHANHIRNRFVNDSHRSSYGTALYNETGDIYLVADVLGHKDVNTTRKHYAQLEDARRREAAKFVHLRKED